MKPIFPTFLEVQLRKTAHQIRLKYLKMHFEAQAGHIGTGLSSIDLLTYLYGMWLAQEDRFILSKGHGASSLYATLHHFKRIPDSLFQSYYKDGTKLPAHPAPLALQDIPAATGSLGHGLPIAAGMAYAFKYLHPRSNQRVACLLSDGEINEGSVWEAILFAAHHKLDNLTMIVDANGLQGFGRTQDVMNTEPLAAKLSEFGFSVCETNGHDFNAIHSAFGAEVRSPDRPHCVVARTVKGKGVSFMEDRLEWHYLPMKKEQYEMAVNELKNASPFEDGETSEEATGT